MNWVPKVEFWVPRIRGKIGLIKVYCTSLFIIVFHIIFLDNASKCVDSSQNLVTFINIFIVVTIVESRIL